MDDGRTLAGSGAALVQSTTTGSGEVAGEVTAGVVGGCDAGGGDAVADAAAWELAMERTVAGPVEGAAGGVLGAAVDAATDLAAAEIAEWPAPHAAVPRASIKRAQAPAFPVVALTTRRTRVTAIRLEAA